MRGLDPRIHLPCKKVFAKIDGLPGHKRVYARLQRAMPGNDNLKLAPSGLPDGTHSHHRCRIAAASTSPRLRGEVDARSAAGEGDSPQTECSRRTPPPRPSPRKRGEGAHRVRGAAIK